MKTILKPHPIFLLSAISWTLVVLASCSHLTKKTSPIEVGQETFQKSRRIAMDPQNISTMEIPTEILATQPNPNRIHLGGFSSLNIIKKTESEIYFRTLTDRGPNSEQIPFLEGVGSYVRVFLLPNFNPSIVTFKFNLKTKSIGVESLQPFLDQTGTPMLGLPNRPQPPEHPESIEIAVDPSGRRLPVAGNGIDPESICQDQDGNYWVGEEYGPDIYVFNSKGVLQKILSPGKGLPLNFASRKANRGIEAITCGNGKIYAMLQSPLPKGDDQTENFFRIVEIDPQKKIATGEYLDPIIDSKLEKIGDISMGPDGRLYVLVQNGKVGPKARQLLYSLELDEKARIPLDENGNEVKSTNLVLTTKSIELDLSPYLKQFEKLEGLAVTEDSFYFVNDNDFGLKGDVDLKTGVAEKDPNKKSYLIHIPRIP